MNEIECARCSWNWIMFEGQTEGDCPFCPEETGGFVFVTETLSGTVSRQLLACLSAVMEFPCNLRAIQGFARGIFVSTRFH